MLIPTRPSWAISENETTSEEVFFNRRKFLKASGLALGGAALGPGAAMAASGAADLVADPNADLYPAQRNKAFQLDRPITAESLTSTYNNFYEFGSSKNIHEESQALQTDPWTVTIDGLVDQPFQISVDDLISQIGVEERIYRHRCVEAWSMVVPWIGFPLAKLVEMAKPLSGAKFVQFQTL